jgi:uncharacterized RDD family membrane protein YckC
VERPEEPVPPAGLTPGDPLAGARVARGEPPAPFLPPTPVHPGAPWVLAEWWRRAFALVLDGLIVGIVAVVLIVVITAAVGGVGFVGGDETGVIGLVVGFLFASLVVALVALVYAPALMSRWGGRTLGKRALGIRVVRVDGERTGFWWSVVREVVLKQIVFAGIAGGFTFGLAWLVDGLWPLWDDERRALHDLPVNSRVVRG